MSRHYLKHQSMNRARSVYAGFSMVEVLVALVVLSVGLLGIASMYVTALQAKTTSGSRMKAVNLAYDIADRMRANPAGAASLSYVLAQGGATTSTNCAATSATCSPAQVAASDLYQWTQLLTSNTVGLPGGAQGWIKLVAAATPTTPVIYQISVSWSEPTASNLRYDLQVQI